jgi:hypothetical protein
MGGEKAEGGAPVNEAQLQQELLRFDGRYTARMVDAMMPFMQSSDPVIHDQALRSTLRLRGAAMEICLGPSPPTNLLDMVAFVELTRVVAQEKTIPKYFNGPGKENLRKAFDESSKDIWKLASKVLDPKQQQILRQIIQDYLKANLQLTYAEGVRLSDFAAISGVEAENQKVSGILASVEGAVKQADAGRLLGERILYFAEHEPLVLRTHAQILSEDVVKRVTQMISKSMAIEEQNIADRVQNSSLQLASLVRIRTRYFFMAGSGLIGLLTIGIIIARVSASYLSFVLIERRKAKSQRHKAEERGKAA